MIDIKQRLRKTGVRIALASVPALALVAAVACSSDNASSDPAETGTTAVTASATVEATTQATQAATATTEATASPAATSEATETTTAATATVSANDASIAELTAAFEAAGISNASRWAREVDEYRPYSVDDTDFAKLRGELAKYNPGPGVVDAIVATLSLP